MYVSIMNKKKLYTLKFSQKKVKSKRLLCKWRKNLYSIFVIKKQKWRRSLIGKALVCQATECGFNSRRFRSNPL